MTIRLTDAVNIAGAHTAAGTTVTLTAGLEADLVQRGKAVYAGQSPQAGTNALSSPACNTIAILSDSRGQMCENFWYGASILSMSRSGGIVTVNINAHGLPSGRSIRVVGAVPATFNGEYIATRVDANNISFSCPGPDGSATVSAASVIDRSHLTGKGFWIWSQMLLGGRMRLLRNASVGGNTTGDMLARLATEIFTLPVQPQWLIVWGLYNDIGAADYNVARSLANLRAIFDACRQRNIRICAVTEPPLHAAGAKWSAASVEYILAANRGIRDAVRESPGMVLADAFRSVVDAGNTTNRGVALSGMHDTDNVHLIGRGQYLVGKAIAAAISPHVPPASPLVTCAGETSVAGVSKYNAFDNCVWVSTGGTISAPATAAVSPPAGGAGTASTGLTCERSSAGGTTCEVYTAPRTDGGFDQGLDITPATAAETWQMRSNTGANILANLQAGEYRRFRCDLTVSGVPSSTFWSVVANITLTIDGVSYTIPIGSGIPIANAINENFAGVFESHPIRIPDGTITNAGWNLQVNLNGAGSKVTVKVGRPSFEITGDPLP